MNKASEQVIMGVVRMLSAGKDEGYKHSIQKLLLQVYELGHADGTIESTERQIKEMSEHHREIMS